ncbi:two-component system, OmpR family, sensor histidine kinase VicK [Anaerolineae bacterium]|nr:two-component system, OmpR family, sensor histidine kinase VicK [Anaerolineae bacterium]
MSRERILVVDDSADIRELIRTMLITAEYDVLTAATGADGLVLAQDLSPDLIVVDYRMPGMDGLTMHEALSQAGYSIPTILLTGEGSEKLAIRAMRTGIADYLVKPIEISELLDAVQRALSRYWSMQIKERLPNHLLEANLKLEKRFREMATLLKIGASVTAMLDLQQVLNRVVESAVDVTGAESGSLMLIDRRTDELYMRAVRNVDQRTAMTLRIKVEDSLIGQVMRTGEPLVFSEREAIKIKTAYFIKSAVYIPLRIQGKAIGVLSVDNRVKSREFDSHDVQMLSLIGNFAAVAIENARLYGDTTQERDTLDAIIRDTDDYIIVVDSEDRVLFCNQTAREALNVTATDFIGRPLTEVISHPEVVDLFSKTARIGRGRHSEVTLDGGERTLNAQLTIIEGIGRAVVMQDISHLKRLDRAKTEFVATVAHDLRSPLTAVLGYTELIQRSGPLTDQQNKFAEQIVSSVHSITDLITELLELSRIESEFNVDLEPVNFCRTAESALLSLEHAAAVKHHQIKREIVPGTLLVHGSGMRLRQMCANLIGNAIKYTPTSGTIFVSVWGDENFVFFRVKDTGIGIAVEDQPFVFDKFYRTERAAADYDGTGLGLSIVKSVVDQHDGRIWLESKEDEGTTFTVMLPCFRPNVQSEVSGEPTAQQE